MISNSSISLMWFAALLLTAVPVFSKEDKQVRVDSNNNAAQPPATPTPALQPRSMTLDMPDEKEGDRPMLQQRNPRYRLRYGDTLELNFAFVPAFNQVVIVQPDGYITLRGLDDIHVEGKTKAELVQAVKAAYAQILQEPVVTAELKDFEKPYFVAGGELGRPGKYELRGDTTVAQAVHIAGGFTSSAKHSQVLLFRRVSDEWVQVTEVDLKKMFNLPDITEDLHLRPGDMVFVPKNRISKLSQFIPKIRLVPGIKIW